MAKKNEANVVKPEATETKTGFDFSSINWELFTKEHPTVSAQIRYLYASGAKRGEIAKYITEKRGKLLRYQHVRNVLITPVKKESGV